VGTYPDPPEVLVSRKKLGRPFSVGATSALALLLCTSWAGHAAPAPPTPLTPVVPAAPLSATERQAFLRRILPALGSTKAQLLLAKSMGATRILGKRLSRLRSPLAAMELNQQVGAAIGVQSEPSIAANPMDANIVVVLAHNDDNLSSVVNACSLYVSLDGGQTFSYAADTGLATTTNHFCSDPVARFSPDGLFLYLSYMDVDDQGTLLDKTDDTDTVRVEVHDGLNPGTAPLATQDIFTGNSGSFADKPWIDVHTWDADGTGAPFVYATATLFSGTSCNIVYNRNIGNGTVAWDFVSTGATLAASASCDATNPATARVVQGSRPAAGPSSQVLVCWYDSGADGWSTGLGSGFPLNKFNIACRSSNDRGATFSGGVAPPETTPGNWIYAAKAVAFEVPYYLGPNHSYHKWYQTEFPAIAIDHLGNAHIVFTYAPGTNPDAADSGNVSYIKSTVAQPTVTAPVIYSRWSARVLLGSGAMAQGFATVAAQKLNQATKPKIWVSYIDHYRSATLGVVSKNLVYDVRYRNSLTGGPSFLAPVLVTDQSSLSDEVFIGDYIDSSATKRRYHVAWTDNVNSNTILDGFTDIFTNRY
jgi:hypothetical protein